MGMIKECLHALQSDTHEMIQAVQIPAECNDLDFKEFVDYQISLPWFQVSWQEASVS